MTDGLLDVGDMIYMFGETSFGRFKIDRVTPKYAFCREAKYFRKIDSRGNVIRLPRVAWGNWDYCIESEQTKQEYDKKKILSKLYGFNFENLPYDELKQLWEIINKYIGI